MGIEVKTIIMEAIIIKIWGEREAWRIVGGTWAQSVSQSECGVLQTAIS